MAFSTRSSLFFFFLFTTPVLLSTQIHARDSYFFGKFHRGTPKDQNPNNVLPLETSQKITKEESIPNKKEQEQEQEQDPPFVPESENGYGLYGHETTYNNNNNEEFNNNNKYDEKVNGETFSTPSLSETEESYNNYDEKYPKKTESYDNNKYNNEEFNNKYDEESFPENNEDSKRSYYNSNAYGTELERETPYKGYSHNLERQGMSDTRFMEKGNYYYDLYNDRNHGHFYRKPQRNHPAGYYTSPMTDNNYDRSYNSYGNNNNEEEEKSFKDPYNSKWEKNMMNEQPEEFVEEQVDHFKP